MVFPMNGASAAAEIEALLDQVETWADGLDRPLLYRTSDGSGWTVMELLAHMAEFLRYWPDVAVAIAAEPGCTFGRGLDDPDRTSWVAAHGDDSLEVALAELTEAGAYARERLQTIPEPGWDAAGIHATWGSVPVSEVVGRVLTGHLASHLQQAKDTYAAIVATPIVSTPPGPA